MSGHSGTFGGRKGHLFLNNCCFPRVPSPPPPNTLVAPLPDPQLPLHLSSSSVPRHLFSFGSGSFTLSISGCLIYETSNLFTACLHTLVIFRNISISTPVPLPPLSRTHTLVFPAVYTTPCCLFYLRSISALHYNHSLRAFHSTIRCHKHVETLNVE